MEWGDRMEREISNMKERLTDLDEKVDKILTDGCSHRGNDIDKMQSIQKVVDEVRNTVHTLSIAVVERIYSMKIWILINCIIILVGFATFVVKEFYIPSVTHEQQRQSGTVTLTDEQYSRLLERALSKR
jgi:hypothetical protein